jgi:hypothetical protein
VLFSTNYKRRAEMFTNKSLIVSFYISNSSTSKVLSILRRGEKNKTAPGLVWSHCPSQPGKAEPQPVLPY